MKKASLWCAWLVLLLLSPIAAAAQSSGGYPSRPGEVLLKLEPGTLTQDRAMILSDLGASSVTPVAAGVELVRITRFTVDGAIARYSAHPKVRFIEPNYVYRTVAVPDDPNFSQLWGLQNTGQTGGIPGADIDATLAWDVLTGSEVLVAIIDSGVDATHPDLSDNVFVNPGEVPGNGIDDDLNGFVDDVRGWDFVNLDNNPADDHGHGTHVSGTVGAVGNNGIGVVGVNWHVRILPIKFLDAFGFGSTAAAVASIDYAVLMGAKVINASWGGGGPSEALELAIAAADSAGVLFVAAAGNAGQNNDAFPNYPSNFNLPNIVAVAASDEFDRLAGFSNYGATTVDLAAPGVAIYSTVPGGYTTASGTSMAAPHVTGALALVLGRFPGISSATAKSLLLATVDTLGSLAGLVATGGRLNAWVPIREPDDTPPGAITDLLAMDPNGTRATLRWSAPGDDGAVGTVHRYEVRYATFPIDDANFGSAEVATGAPPPAAAGSPQEMQVKGLTFSSTYYFAIKSFDEMGNISPLSNVASATTLGPPVIAVTPAALQEDLLSGRTASQVLTVSNAGQAELNLEIALGPALSTNTLTGGRIVRKFPVPASSGTSASAAPGQYPVSSTPYAEGHTAARALLGQESVQTFNLQAGTLRILLLHTGNVFEIRGLLAAYPDVAVVDELDAGVTPSLAQLLAYDAVIVAVNRPVGQPVGLGNVLADYVDAGGGVVLTIASFISGWAIEGRFLTDGYSPFPPGSGPTGPSTLATWNTSHPIMDGVTSAAGDLLGLVSLSPGAELVASYLSAQPMVATKGASVAAVNIFVAESGFWIGDVPRILHNAALWASAGLGQDWLSADPDSAVVPAGSQIGVVVTFDATNLDGGDYESRLVVSSDDPIQRRVEVPVQLHVTGAPRIVVEGEQVVVESAVDFTSDGALTTHRLPVTVPVPVGAGGTLELIANGDFGFPSEIATATAEGRVLGSVGETGEDCTPATGTFPQDAAQLGALVADGVVEVQVQNDIAVGAFCLTNRHTLQLRYASAADRLDFGSLHVGRSRELAVTVRNAGSAPLEVTITSDQGEFTPGAATLTVAPRTEQRLAVTFQPGSAGELQGTLQLSSNDPEAPSISIALTGTGVPPPVVGVQPTSLASTLLEGNQETQTLRITNSGTGPLEFSLEIHSSAAGTRWVPFAGLSAAGASNNAAPMASGTPPVTGDSGPPEPAFAAAVAQMESLTTSPAPLTCVAGDPVAGIVYAQANFGTAFYRYVASQRFWERLADAPMPSGNNGGAALLNGRIYTTYTENGIELGVYDIASNTWSTRPHPLGAGTGNICSDGAALYFALGFQLVRLDPATGNTVALAPPQSHFEPWGGLHHLAGKLYGHQGNGLSGFATYDLATDSWTNLVPVPGGTVLGATIDPVRREYFAYGSYFGTNLYQYSIDSGTWSVSTIPFFFVNDGGLAWLGGPSSGVYYVQGESGTGFARQVQPTSFLTVSPTTGVVPALGAVDVSAHFATGDLLGGTYYAAIAVTSNDPITPRLDVPATLTVIGSPRMVVEGDPVVLESAVDFSGDGALTTHRLAVTVPVPAGAGGSLELIAEGDYGAPFETATATAEGAIVGSVGSVGPDCVAATGAFPLAPALLQALVADGAVDVQVQNTFDVNIFCAINRHTVRLSYPRSMDRLDFGALFVGLSRELAMTVRNTGSAALEVTITSDRAEFTPSVESMTVPPRSARQLTVSFTPGAPGAFQGALQLASNDPNNPNVSIALTGTGLIPPDIAVTPTALEASLLTGGTASRTVTIENTGESDLDFTVAFRTSGASVAQRTAAPLAKGEADTRPGDLVAASRGGPDAFGHRWRDSDEPDGPTFQWTEISGIGTAVPFSGDDWNFGPVPIGFNFPFYGQPFNSVFICSNGWISFTSASAQYAHYPLPSGSAPENLLSAFWADLFAPDASVFYHSDGTRLIVEYRNVTYLGQSTPFTFQIAIYPSGRIVYQYLDMAGTQTIASVGLQNATQNDGLTIAFNNPYVRDGLAVEISTIPQWLSATPDSGTVSAGGRQDLEVRFDAAGLFGGDYLGEVVVSSNDPDEPEVAVSALLHVTGAPDIALSRTAIDYGTLFVGAARAESLLVTNAGTELLTVSAITPSRADYEVDVASAFSLVPGASRTVLVTFRPAAAGPANGTLTVTSDDSDEPSLQVALNGEGLVPPDVAVAPDSLSVALYTGGTANRTLTITNSGGSDLDFQISVRRAAPTPGLGPDPPPSSPRAANSQVGDNSPVAARFGAAVDSIASVLVIQNFSSWGLDMGSFILSRFGIAPTVINSAQIAATDFSSYNLVITVGSQDFGYYDAISANVAKFEAYLTQGGVVQYQLATQGANVQIANGVLVQFGSLEFLNRVLLPSHPIVAGLPAILDGSYANHCYLTQLPVDAQIITETSNSSLPTTVEYAVGLGTVIATGMTWEYLYLSTHSSQPMLYQATEYSLSLAHPTWVRATPDSGTVAPGGSLDVQVTFDASGLLGGDYDASIRVASNDPDEAVVAVPAHMHVTAAPDIALSRTAIDYGAFFVGLARSESLQVHNEGVEVLTVSEVTASRAEYEVDLAGGFSLEPGASRTVMVTFRPAAVGPAAGTLSVRSDDPDEGEVQVALTGVGLPPPDIAFAPASIEEDLLVGGSSVRALRIANDGGSPLEVVLGLRLPGVAVTTASAAATTESRSRATPIRDEERARYVEDYRAHARDQVAALPKGRTAAAAVQADSLPPGAFVLFSDDMESGTGAWAHYATSDSVDQWSLQASRSNSGSWSWNGSQHPSYGSDALQSPPIDLTSTLDATLSFKHWYQFDDCSDPTFDPDGGIVEISTDGGANWQQLVPVGGYPYVLDDICLNPLAFREAYSHSTGPGPFVPADFDLTPFVGNSILLRFHAGWDCGNCSPFNEGWFIDDVVVYSRGPAWVSVAPAGMTIAPHGTAMASLSFDATGLAVGSYDAQLVLRSNDPDEPEVMVPVNLQVADIAAQMDLDPGTLNLKRRGKWVTAYVLLPPSVPRESVVLSTLRLNRVVPPDLAKSKFCSGNGDGDDQALEDMEMSEPDDDDDGPCDLKLKFPQDLLAPTLGDEDTARVVLSGEVAGGHRLLAFDEIRVKRPKMKKPHDNEHLVVGSSYTVEWERPSDWGATQADVYVSLNGGASWSPVAAGVPGTTVAWTVPSLPTQLGLFRVELFDGEGLIGSGASDQPFTIGAAATAVDAPALGGRLGLLQNRPNPFRSAAGTSIGFVLPRSAVVRLAIYDVRGNLVHVLADAWLPAGRHDRVWNGRDRHGRAVASGVYFFELREGGMRATKRMVVLQ